MDHDTLFSGMQDEISFLDILMDHVATSEKISDHQQSVARASSRNIAYIVGSVVTNTNNVPDNMVTKIIPEAEYAVFTAIGDPLFLTVLLSRGAEGLVPGATKKKQRNSSRRPLSNRSGPTS